jgi:hypothetical protein
MKAKYAILLLLLFSSSLSFGQSKLFDKYADMDNVSSVYISKAMFQMMPVIENVGLSIANLKGKMESLQLVSTDRAALIPQMRKEFTQLIGSTHQELMRVRDGKLRTTFYANMSGDKVKDLLMLVDSDDKFTVIQILGSFTLKDVQEVAGERTITYP